MKTRTGLIVIFVVIVLMILIVIWSNAARGQEIDGRKLSRAEQIQIMRECWEDSGEIYTKWSKDTKMRDVALTFFHYRTGMLPIQGY